MFGRLKSAECQHFSRIISGSVDRQQGALSGPSLTASDGPVKAQKGEHFDKLFTLRRCQDEQTGTKVFTSGDGTRTFFNACSWTKIISPRLTFPS